MPVDSTALVQWADRQDAWTKLPILIRRLIRETTPSIEQLTFPGGDAVNLPGFDGKTACATGTTWVPAGDIVWEMGCSREPLTKARADFAKRSANTPETEQQNLTFVFVTPRRWQGRDAWVTEARSAGAWADVRTYDATDLETWLEEAPVTRRWLGELLGLASAGLLTPDEWWTGWSSTSKPPIPHALVTSRRNGEGERLLANLRQGDRMVTVSGDDRKEAIAFVLATMMQAKADDLLDRTLVLTRADASLGTRSILPPIVIVDLPEGQEINPGDRSRIVLVRPYAKGRLSEKADIELSYVGYDAFRTCLRDMGFNEDEAERRAKETGHSITVLRRRLSDDPEVRRPVWARGESAQALLPFAFAGSWLDGDRSDDEAALSLLANRAVADLHQDRDRLLQTEDAPLARYGAVNVIVSQIDALFALGAFMRTQDLDRFFDVALMVLGERDPALDLPRDEWWMANVKGKGRPYSGTLISGIGDALCIMAVHGQAICGQRLGINVEGRVNRVVRELMTGLTEEQWLSRRSILRPLAEAAPATFLECLETELRRPDLTIAAIMGTVNGGISGECLRTDLLWALETLGWHPEHFGRVAAVTMDLRRFDTKDNWSNTAAATAAALFRAWVPSTAVNVNARMGILRQLSQTYRAPVIDVCISLLPEAHSVAFNGVRPRWRTVDAEIPPATNHDVRLSIIGASRLLLDMAPFSTDELATVLDAFSRLHPDDQARVVTEVARWAETAGDEDKARLQDVARNELGQVAFHKQDAGDATRLMEQVYAMLEPVLLQCRHRWLFKQQHVDWPELEQDEITERISWEERNTLIRKRRAAALAEIGQNGGRDAVFAFAMSAGAPDVVADSLLDDDTPEDDVLTWVNNALCHSDLAPAKAFLGTLLWCMSKRDLSGFIARLSSTMPDEDAKRLVIAEKLPGIAAGWRAVEHLGPEATAHYWQHAQIHGFWDDLDEARLAVDQLLLARRPLAAFLAAHWKPERLNGESWQRILQAIVRGAEPGRSMPSAYDLNQVFKQLDGDFTISDDDIAHLELPFIRALRPYGDHRSSDRTLALHRQIARWPEHFVTFISWLYGRADCQKDDAMANADAATVEVHGQIAFDILHSWTEMPGLGDDGTIDPSVFREWNAETRRRAQEAGRIAVTEQTLGGAFARFASRQAWERWLPDPIAELLDQSDASVLREGFEIGVYNARGVTTRGPYDGGAQERQLAAKFREAANRYEMTHPRLAATIRKIAAHYDREAEQHDQQAALGERWHH